MMEDLTMSFDRLATSARIWVTLRSRTGQTASDVPVDAVTSSVMPAGHVRFIFPADSVRPLLFRPEAIWRIVEEKTGMAYAATLPPKVLPCGTVVVEAASVNLFKAEKTFVRPNTIARFRATSSRHATPSAERIRHAVLG